MTHILLHKQAVHLRTQGLSYSEIRSKLQVSKSTLSEWLRYIPLQKHQEKRLYDKGAVARALGSKALKEYRIKKTKIIIEGAINEVSQHKIDLWLVGAILYWAEGHKQKVHNPSQRLMFSNSDPHMIAIYMKWPQESLKIEHENLTFDIYIHETYKKSKAELIKYWSNITKVSAEYFNHTYFKKNKVFSYRKNRGKKYFGVLRICVRRSADLNRKVTGWIQGITKELNVQI